MSDAQKDQAETAISYIETLYQIETGAYNDNNKGRELTKDEKEVKESALTCLLTYFTSDFGKLAAEARRAMRGRAKKKKRKKVKH